jgi:hypothetical protein
MTRNIYINYFRDSDPARRDEYLQCIRANLALPWLDHMWVFLDHEDHARDLPTDPRIHEICLGRRMEFRDALDHAHHNLGPGSIVIILNLDIEILDGPHWATIDRDFFDQGHPAKTLVLKRHNLREDGSLWIEEYSWRKGEYCDAYVLRTPLDPALLREDLGFCVGGAPQCDNLMMYLMSRYYHVYSWGSQYRIVHRDLARKPRDASQMIVNSATDYRASVRRDQHIDIPAYQDWPRLLATEQQPQYLPTWRIHQVEFVVDVPMI